MIVNKKQKTCRITELKMKIKEYEKRDKYFDLSNVLKSLEREDDDNTDNNW